MPGIGYSGHIAKEGNADDMVDPCSYRRNYGRCNYARNHFYGDLYFLFVPFN